MSTSTRFAWICGLGLALGAAGCGGKGDEDSGPLISAGGGDDGDEECSGTAPVITQVSCVNTGIQPHFETGVDTVTMKLLVDFEDEDGDLKAYGMSIYIDESVDGSVSPSDSPWSPLNRTLDVDTCAGFEAEVEVTLYLSGSRPAFDTLYEWGLVVTDQGGYQSDMFVVECVTPAADGSDGTGGGR
jgi:hypothetical protein